MVLGGRSFRESELVDFLLMLLIYDTRFCRPEPICKTVESYIRNVDRC